MTDKDRIEFMRILTKLGAVYGATVNPDVVDSYFLALKTLDLATIEEACQKAVENCQFMPKPVELRALSVQPERFDRGVLDHERTYACLKCEDRAVVLTDRYDETGRNLGVFASPCTCAAGERKREAWDKKDAHGKAFSDAAKANTATLRNRGAL